MQITVGMAGKSDDDHCGEIKKERRGRERERESR
jgi:hypothetical protein